MENTKNQEVLNQIIQEAWGNADFKAALLENPVPAIEALTGEKISIPEGKTLVVRDQTAEDTIYINIPRKRQIDSVELNEDQLDAVAGGTDVGKTVYDPTGDIIIPTDGSTGPYNPNGGGCEL